jgi:hypothetical protein
MRHVPCFDDFALPKSSAAVYLKQRPLNCFHNCSRIGSNITNMEDHGRQACHSWSRRRQAASKGYLASRHGFSQTLRQVSHLTCACLMRACAQVVLLVIGAVLTDETSQRQAQCVIKTALLTKVRSCGARVVSTAQECQVMPSRCCAPSRMPSHAVTLLCTVTSQRPWC